MIIELQSVSFTYRTPEVIPVFSNVTFTIGDSECIGIIGRTGSGKSTLLQLCAGLIQPDTGRIAVNGILMEKLSNWRQFRRKIGIVFQFPEEQLFEETVFDDVAFGLTQNNTFKDEIFQKVHTAMKWAGLPPDQYAHRSPYQLSCGEKRRVAIAGVLASDTEMVFLDEPTIGLDYTSVKVVESLINRIYSNGKTVCIASHNSDFLSRVAGRIIVIHKGTIAADMPKRELFQKTELLEEFQVDIPSVIKIRKLLNDKYNIPIPESYDIGNLIQSYQEMILLRSGEK